MVENPAGSNPAEQETVPESISDILNASVEKVAKPEPDEKPEVVEPDETVEATAEPEPKPEATAEPEPKPEATAEPEPVVPAGDDIAPTRFAAGAQAKWNDVPPEVKTEVHRALTELTTGIDGYRERLQPFAGCEQYVEMAAQSGTTIRDALQHYAGIEAVLSQNPVAGLKQICENIGVDPKQAGELLAGQAPSTPDDKDREIAQLRQQVQNVQYQLQTYQRTQQQQIAASAQQEIEQFAVGKPDFPVLKEIMGQLITSGMAKSLSEAYDKARALNPHLATPVQTKPTPAAKPVQSDRTAQTRKGSLTPTGAPKNPSGGSSASKGATSISAALSDAMSKVIGG